MEDGKRRPETRILIADSQAVLRLGMRLALEEQQDLRVVAEACRLDSALEALTASRPDVAVVEMELLGENLSAMIQRFLEKDFLSLVLLSGSNDPGALSVAISLGVRAILSKSSPMESVVDAIRAVRRDVLWMPPQLAARLTADEPEAERGEDAWAVLTPRERDVAVLVARGLPYSQVARRLSISDHTVKNHLRRIYDKLDINSRVELAVTGARGARS